VQRPKYLGTVREKPQIFLPANVINIGGSACHSTISLLSFLSGIDLPGATYQISDALLYLFSI